MTQILWNGPDRPKLRVFRSDEDEHLATLFGQLGDAGVAVLVEQAGRWLQFRAHQTDFVGRQLPPGVPPVVSAFTRARAPRMRSLWRVFREIQSKAERTSLQDPEARRFFAACETARVAGDGERVATREIRSENPMSLTEAQVFIARLLKRWLISRS